MIIIKGRTPPSLIFLRGFTQILLEMEKDVGTSRSERMVDEFREVVEGCVLRDMGAP